MNALTRNSLTCTLWLNEQADLGIFTVRLTMIDVDGDNVNLTSVATVNVSSLVDRITQITCDGDGDGLNGKDALLINGKYICRAV